MGVHCRVRCARDEACAKLVLGEQVAAGGGVHGLDENQLIVTQARRIAVHPLPPLADLLLALLESVIGLGASAPELGMADLLCGFKDRLEVLRRNDRFDRLPRGRAFRLGRFS